MDYVNQVSNYVNKSLEFVSSNRILSAVIGLLLVLYAAMAAPKLPKAVVKIFDNSLFKLGYMFLMAYLVTKDPSVAIISAAALLITIQTLSSYEVADQAVQAVKASMPEKSVGEIKSELPAVSIPLTPVRAELIETSAKLAEAHHVEAEKAKAEGNVVLAEAHQQEAQKQEEKINGAIKAKEHKLAAMEAEHQGDLVKAEAHKQESAKLEEKVEAIVKAEVETKVMVESKLPNAFEDQSHADKHASVLTEVSSELEAVPTLVKTETRVQPQTQCGDNLEFSGYAGSDYANF